jgi:hypothetical protein
MVAAGVAIAVGQFLEQVAVAERLPVVVVAEHVGRTADGHRAIGPPGEQLAGVDDVDRAEAEAFVDVGLLAERGGGEDLDGVAPVGALLELLGRPHRPGVVGLAGFVDVGPFELGLGRGRPDHADRQQCGGTDHHPPSELNVHRHACSLARNCVSWIW